MRPLNIYHVTVAKTASRWFLNFFEHPKIKAITRMGRYDFETEDYGKWDDRDFMSREAQKKIPPNLVCSPLYMGFDNYHSIPKPDHYKSFCLWRDPRDVLVSFYFSCRYSHPPIGKHPIW